jgi:hypothetical protein
MAKLGQRAFARHIGVTLRAVQKAITSGRIGIDAEGKIDAETATAAWRRNTDESKKSFADLARSNRATAADDTELPADPDDTELPADPDDAELPADPDAADFPAGAPKDDPSLASYRASRAAREATRHERELIELGKLRGSLIDLSEAQRVGYTAFRAMRDAVLNVPVRVKDLIAAESDPARVERMLEDELTSALSEIKFHAMMRDHDPDD